MRAPWVMTLALTMLLTACSTAPPGGTPTANAPTQATAPQPTPRPLVGTAWTLTGIVAGEAVTSPVAGTTVTLRFTDDTLSGKACNTFRGAVTIEGDALTVGPLASTRMACVKPGEGEQEATVLSILGDVTGYAIDGDALTLTAPDSKGLVFTA